MTTAVIGAIGRVGSEIVRGLLARGDAVAALVRDPGKARRAFGSTPRRTHWDQPAGPLTASTSSPVTLVAEFLHEYRAEFA